MSVENMLRIIEKSVEESPFDLPLIMSATFAEDGIASEIMEIDFLFFESGKRGMNDKKQQKKFSPRLE